MTVHVRQQIREAFKLRLMSRIDGASVHVGRRYPFTPAELESGAAILVYSQSPSTERSQILTMGGPTNRRLGREMMMIIDTIAADSDSVEDILDATGAAIEAAVDEDVSFTTEDERLTKDVSLASSDLHFAQSASGISETPIGVLRQTWRVNYHTLTGTPHRAA